MSVRKSRLRAVEPDDAPAPKILTLDEAIESGDYVDILLAQRREMVKSLPDVNGPALAALHRQVSMVSKEIESLRAKDSDGAEGGADVEDGEFRAEAI